MPKPYPREFRDDVIRVARNRDAGVTLEQIAKDFGIHPMTLSNWISKESIDNGTKPGVTSSESAENRELRRRVKLLEQENEGGVPFLPVLRNRFLPTASTADGTTVVIVSRFL